MGMFTSNNNYSFQNPANMGQNNMFGGSFNGGNLQNSAMNYNIAQNVGPGAQQYIPGFFPQQAQQPYFPQQPPQQQYPQQPPQQQYPQQPPAQYPQYPQYPQPQYPQYYLPQQPQYCPPMFCPPQEPQMPTIIQQPIYYPVQQQPDFPDFSDFPSYPPQPPQYPQQPPQQDQSLPLLFSLLKLLGDRQPPAPAPVVPVAPAPAPEPERRHHTSTRPSAPTTSGGNTGGTWGDPHFKDLTNTDTTPYARDYDVKGEVGKVYNILSDKGIQFNSKFVAGDPTIGTIMGDMGIKLHADDGSQFQSEFDAISGVAKFNGEVMKEGDTHTTKVGGQDATVSLKNGKLVVDTSEYHIELNKSPDGNHAIQEIKVKDGGVLADYVPPHGLLGQSADGDDNIRHSTDENGTGAIDWNYKKYEVKDIFADPDNDINRFGKDTDVRVEGGKVSRIFDKQGNVLMTLDDKGKLVSVRRIPDDKGQDVLYLADGKTKVDKDGGIIKAA